MPTADHAASRDRARPSLEARHGRWAVSLIFFLNGASFCAILPRYPELVTTIGLSNTAFGLAVGLGPLGGLLAGLAAAVIMRRLGSARTAVTFQIIASTSHLMIYVAQSWLWLMLALMAASAADSITDIAMNRHGMRVERRYGRSIMNSYHGWWSLGAVAGGIVGAACAQFAVPLWLQGLLGVLVFGAAASAAYRWTLPGHDRTERDLTAGPAPASAGEVPGDVIGSASHGRMIAGQSLRAVMLVLCLGIVLVFAGSTEDAGNTWGALFMDDTFAVTPFVAGLAFVALQGAQTIGRFTGDAVVDALGDRLTARLGALLSGIGMTFALLVPSPVTALIGFAMAGWGIATLFPAAFRAADEMEGLSDGMGVTLVGWIARVGFFVSPPVVGALADAFTLRWALLLMPIYAVGILLFSFALDPRRPTVTSHSAEQTVSES